MWNDGEVRRRLMAGAAAAFAGDALGLEATKEWLTRIAASELLRVDALARRWRWEGPALGWTEQWTQLVLDQAAVAAPAVASMHPDGHVRERAVDALAPRAGALADRALALRLTAQIRDTSLLDIPLPPKASTRSSPLRVDTPCT